MNNCIDKTHQVDWFEQWSLFAENFSDGKAHINLGGPTLLLTPGPGFGDLSHPTTYLMIEMLKKHIRGESVLDIGTGSGILALSALFLGARSAIGIDIDAGAIQHAKQNAKLNRLKATFRKTLPKNMPAKQILLMNMILSEQQQVKPARLNSYAKLWIVSGILETQREKYLAQAAEWGWEPLSEEERGGWLGLVFRLRAAS
jgi:ribosomal protein L11 methyltransferase